ncbi:FAD-dependent oxidoreductase [Klenkia terrae]|uniref:FAD-dependent oxidoreductase n=1 Tax=Klenkia terrae TaxID=1052259 RepID=UPI00360EECE2
MSDRFDAVVVGAGINGMVAAAELAGAGWRVALVDEHDRIGGFIASDELTLPGYTHDTFSSWHPLFMAGGAYAALGADLHRHGLVYRNAEGPVTASVSERGAVVADRDPAATAATFEHPEDAAAYAAMLTQLERWSPHVFGALGSRLGGTDAARLGLGALRGLGRAEVVELVRVAGQSGRGLVRERFAGHEVDQLWAPWLLHAGLAPDQATGGLMLPVMAFTMHAVGLPVVEGGAGRFTEAFGRLLAERGVEVVLGAPAERIEVQDGLAVAVHVGGRRLSATKAVLASTATGRLYGDLLRPEDVDDGGRQAVVRHRPGRAAAQLHLALDRPLSWADSRLDAVPLVHVSNGSDSTGVACAQAEAGLLPAEPTVVVGQQTVLDPTRAPAGGATLWLQLQELPWAPTGDAAGEIDTTGGWTPRWPTPTPTACWPGWSGTRLGWATGWWAGTSSPRPGSARPTPTPSRATRTAGRPSWTSRCCGGRAPAPGTAPGWPGCSTSAPSPTRAPAWAAAPATSWRRACSGPRLPSAWPQPCGRSWPPSAADPSGAGARDPFRNVPRESVAEGSLARAGMGRPTHPRWGKGTSASPSELTRGCRGSSAAVREGSLSRPRGGGPSWPGAA